MGEFSKEYTSGFGIKAVWTAIQSISGNYSDVNVTAILMHNELYCAALSGSYIQIGSDTLEFVKSINWSGGNTETTLATHSATVYHEPDGSKNVYIGVAWTFRGTYSGIYFDSIFAEQTVTLPTIPRASSFDVEGSMEKGLTITIKASASSFNHQVGIKVGDYTKHFGITQNRELFISAKALEDLAKHFGQKSKTATATIILHTYTGKTLNTWIAQKESAHTLTIPETEAYKPTFTLELEKYSWLADVSEGDVWYTNVTGIRSYAWNPTAKYGAYIDKCDIYFGNTLVSDNTDKVERYRLHSGYWTKSGPVTVKAVVTDSRGLKSEQTETVTFVAHNRPKFLEIGHRRLNISEDLDNDKLVLTPKVSYDENVGHADIVCSYKLHYGENTIENNIELTPNTENITEIKVRKTSSYDFVFSITDGLGDVVSYTMLIPTAQVDFHLHNGSAKFGGYVENFKGLECDWNAKFNKTVYIGDETLEAYVKRIAKS